MKDLNGRQRRIMHYLLSNGKQLYTIKELSEMLGSSDKTIRNDMKVIIETSKQLAGVDIRIKRGSGIHVAIDQHIEDDLIEQLNAAYESKDQNMVAINIAVLLLNASNKHLLLKDIAREMYISINEVKVALAIIGDWMEKFSISIVVKKGKGIQLQGREIDFRNASRFIASLQMNRLSNHEILIKEFGAVEYKVVSDQVNQVFNEILTNDEKTQLMTHLLIMIHRIKSGHFISIEIPITEKEMTHVLNELCDQLEQHLSIKINENERRYLTLHLPERHDSNLEPAEEVLRLVENLMDEMKHEAMIDFSTDEQLKLGLMTHMTSTIDRMYLSVNINNPLLTEIKKSYPFIFSSVVNAIRNLESKLKYKIPENEMGYITLHFQAAYERMKSTEHKKVVIVCHLGVGISQMLRVRIEKRFPNFIICDVIKVDETVDYIQKNDIDMIVTTIKLDIDTIPVIQVSPLLTTEDEQSLGKYTSSIDIKSPNQSLLMKYLKTELIHMNTSDLSRYELIELIGSELIEAGYVQKAFVQSVSHREFLSSTAVGYGVSIPHGKTEYVEQSSISLAILKEPIIWGEENVSIVFLTALTEEDKKYYHQIYREINDLIEDEETMLNLKHANSKEEIIRLIKRD
ncbi:BglG family transcription antiterminator [Mammaliicoccus sp. Dog046]|uniref:BglG family transcription antiterminator n=1 Tax=Mammaliicoccus sp. Dog046 TaxID=3034233 RepID=UPI002B259148|nr:BglG family transcription antiterminator [Mammaliicoccus sp. Dog046]WQK86024.1 BglG family transcription antiterminator [Mammaliicoccus sp. Dog046]